MLWGEAAPFPGAGVNVRARERSFSSKEGGQRAAGAEAVLDAARLWVSGRMGASESPVPAGTGLLVSGGVGAHPVPAPEGRFPLPIALCWGGLHRPPAQH